MEKIKLETTKLGSQSRKEMFDIINNEEHTNKYILMIKKIFEKFFSANENLLEGLITEYLKLKKLETNKQ